MPKKIREESDERVGDGLSLTERIDLERTRSWAYYINGGGGAPEYFDRPTWLKMQERSR
jgi:hypothetical protein